VRKKPKRKLSTAAWFAIGCGGVIVIGLIVMGVLYVMLTGEPAPPPEATADAASDGATTAQPAPAAPPLEQQVEAVARAEQSDRPVPVTMRIRESELNRALAAENTGQVRDLQVYLGDGTIAATGETDYRGRTIHLTIRGTPAVSNGQLRFELQEVLVGRLQAPDSVRQEIQAEIARGLQKTFENRNVQVDSVQVQPDLMVVSGRVGG
jgi:hypothetical protein